MATPVCWTIAGSDSGGGAGIQADLKTFHAFGTHGCSVITSLTAQNTLGVHAVEHASGNMIDAQLAALQSDLPARSIKIGMLGAGSTVSAVARALRQHTAYVVCDPVLRSSSGKDLLDADALGRFKLELLPQVDLLTPNLPEAEALLGRALPDPSAVEEGTRELLGLGPRSVLLKGGHANGPLAQDYWTNGERKAWLSLPRRTGANTHGTGCVLSSAIAACFAKGVPELDAVVLARAYVNQGIRTAIKAGAGNGPLNLGAWPASPEDLPWITDTAEEGAKERSFPDCGLEPLGLYPIVDRVAWLKKLLPLGITTVQLRIKDMDGPSLEQEVKEGIAYARRFSARLFINDQWPLAVRHGAYGVHIGQDDLETADLDVIERAGLRLGLSTHSYAEIARAWACRPSYLAMGTLFKTTSKVMDYPALGLESFQRMRRLLGVPVVAIGGISLERASEVLDAGADGVAVISEITKADPLPERVASWLDLLRERASARSR